MSAVTDAMVDVANTAISERRGMRAALEAALEVSPHVGALKYCPLPSQSADIIENYRRFLIWMYSGYPDVASLIIDLGESK